MTENPKESLKRFLELAIDHAMQQGADLILGRGVVNRENQIRFSQGKIDINKQWLSNKVELAIIVEGGKLATTEISPTSDKAVKQEVENTISFAHKIDPSPFFKGVEETIKPFPTVEKVYDSRIKEFIGDSPELVNSAIDAAIEAGAKRVSGSLLFGEKSETNISSAGPKGEFTSTYYMLTVRAFQETLDSSGQGLTSGRVLDQIEDKFLQAGERAGSFSKAHSECIQGQPGTYDLILAPAVGGNLLGGLVRQADPIQIIIGRSPFADKIGETLAPEYVNITDNPLIPNGLRSAPYDFEGTPHQQTPIIENGTLVSFIHNTSTGKMFNTQTTGNSNLVDFAFTGSKVLVPVPSNTEFNNGDHSFEEILEGSNPTIYVTCNWYTRFTSQISTDFSTIPRDAMFLVENGELGQPIKNVRISDNLLRMLKNIEAMGNDRVQLNWWEVRTPTFLPTIKVKDCRITTATI